MPKPLVKPGHPRSAVVTGAARGIGRAIATELVGRGYDVVVTDVDAARPRSPRVRSAPRWAGLDVTDPEANRVDRRGRPDRAARRVGLQCGRRFDGDAHRPDERPGPRDRRRQLPRCGLGRPGRRRGVPRQAPRASGGDIGIPASLSSHGPVPGLSIYAATKAAALSLATSLSVGAQEGQDPRPRGLPRRRRHRDGARDGARAAQARALVAPARSSSRPGRAGARRHVRHPPGLQDVAGWRGSPDADGSLAPGPIMRREPVIERVGRRKTQEGQVP